MVASTSGSRTLRRPCESEQRRRHGGFVGSAAGSGAGGGRRVVRIAPALAEGVPPADRWLGRVLHPPIAAINEATSEGSGERGGCTSPHQGVVKTAPHTAPHLHRAPGRAHLHWPVHPLLTSSSRPHRALDRRGRTSTIRSVQSHKAKGAASVFKRATRRRVCKPNLARSSGPRSRLRSRC